MMGRISPISLISSGEDETHCLNNLVANLERGDTSTSINDDVNCLAKFSQYFRRCPILKRKRSITVSDIVSDIKSRRSLKHTALLSFEIPSPVSSTQPHKSLRGKDVPAVRH